MTNLNKNTKQRYKELCKTRLCNKKTKRLQRRLYNLAKKLGRLPPTKPTTQPQSLPTWYDDGRTTFVNKFISPPDNED